MYYRAPQQSVCADVIPFFDDNEFKLFYLRDYRNVEQHGEGCPWCLLTTSDLVRYKEHGPVLLRGNKDEQDLYVFTGCCVKIGGKYYIYYTGHNPHLRAQGLPEQKILRAVSEDLTHWTKDENFVMQAPEQYEKHDFRDPFVFYDEDKKKYYMLLAGREKSDKPSFSRGVTLIASSDDADKWEVESEPFYAPHAYFTHECPDLFRMGEWWYLVFSEFTDKIVTTYRMSKSPFGPWTAPADNTFDGHAFYAAKTAFDGKRRILFGWNCIKDEEKDDNFWQWGGTIIPHEIVQAEDGTLYVKCPDEIKAAYSSERAVFAERVLGSVFQTENGVRLCGDGKSLARLGELPEYCRLDMTITTSAEKGDFGVILRESSDFDNYYCVKFDPSFNRLTFDKQPRRDNTVHCHVDVERRLPIKVGEPNTVTMIIEGSVLEVYVNDKVAMSARMFDFKVGNFGVYTHNADVVFGDIKLFTQP